VLIRQKSGVYDSIELKAKQNRRQFARAGAIIFPRRSGGYIKNLRHGGREPRGILSIFYQQILRIIATHPLKLCLRYPNRRKPSTQRKEIVTMSSKNTNKLNVPQARAAMDKFKMEAANEEDVYPP